MQRLVVVGHPGPLFTMDVQDHLTGLRLAVQVAVKHRGLSKEEVEELLVQTGSSLYIEQVDTDQPDLRWSPLLYFEMTEGPVQLSIGDGFASTAMRDVDEQAVGGFLGGVELFEQGIEDGYSVFPRHRLSMADSFMEEELQRQAGEFARMVIADGAASLVGAVERRVFVAVPYLAVEVVDELVRLAATNRARTE